MWTEVLGIVFAIYLSTALIVFAECLYADYGHHDAALGTTNPIWADHFIAISINIGLAVIWPIVLWESYNENHKTN